MSYTISHKSHEFKPGDLLVWTHHMYRSWASHRGYGEVVMLVRYTDWVRPGLRQCEVLTANGQLCMFLSHDFEKYNNDEGDEY